jgi:hypothetical protein
MTTDSSEKDDQIEIAADIAKVNSINSSPISQTKRIFIVARCLLTINVLLSILVTSSISLAKLSSLFAFLDITSKAFFSLLPFRSSSYSDKSSYSSEYPRIDCCCRCSELTSRLLIKSVTILLLTFFYLFNIYSEFLVK